MSKNKKDTSIIHQATLNEVHALHGTTNARDVLPQLGPTITESWLAPTIDRVIVSWVKNLPFQDVGFERTGKEVGWRTLLDVDVFLSQSFVRSLG